jgi:hypothetical protein
VAAKGWALLRVIKDFRDCGDRALATVHNPSMHRVGTKIGTVRRCEDALAEERDR